MIKTVVTASVQFCSVQLLSHVWLFVTPWTAVCQASLSITKSQSLLELMSIESVMPSSHLICCRPLFLLPSIFPSIRVFFHELALRIRWPKYWSFCFSISPSNEYSGLISFRMDWLDLLAIRGTLKSLLQHHSWKASILWRSAFFIVQLSHPYMTTGKTIALTRRTFVDKVISLFFNMLSRFVITFLPRSKRLLISWLQSPSAVILEPPKMKSANICTVSPSICHEVMGPDAMILVFWRLRFKPTFSLTSFTFINSHYSVQFSCSVMSDSLWPRESQHARPLCPSRTPGVHPNSCPSSWWCHPAISSSVVPFSSCPQSLPASGSFPMSQLFASGRRSIGVSVSTSVLPVNIQDWFPLGWTGWTSLQSKGLSRVFCNNTVQKHQFFCAQLPL